jgi:hypothetical protein
MGLVHWRIHLACGEYLLPRNLTACQVPPCAHKGSGQHWLPRRLPRRAGLRAIAPPLLVGFVTLVRSPLGICGGILRRLEGPGS